VAGQICQVFACAIGGASLIPCVTFEVAGVKPGPGVDPPDPIAMHIQFGTVLSGIVGTTLAEEPLTLQVVDQKGVGVANDWVTFTVLTGGGSLSSEDGEIQGPQIMVQTDNSGIARAVFTIDIKISDKPCLESNGHGEKRTAGN